MSTTHTPAHWQIGSTTTFRGDQASEIMSGDDTVAICTNYSPADAALIAAAPELLEALRDAADALNIHAPDSWVLTQARAAIAKAGGAA